MALRPIVKEGDKILRTHCREVTVFDAQLAELLDDMTETMFDAHGAGLAAPQVGILMRVCVVCADGETVYELVNPVVLKASGRQVGPEGCLSIPSYRADVERPKKLTVEYCDRLGVKHVVKVDGFTAVAFCHEMDHLDGVLFTDRAIEKKSKQ